MQCARHGALERLGIPTAAVATEPFVDEALEQARVLGMPDYRMVFIPHPVQLLTADELRELRGPGVRRDRGATHYAALSLASLIPRKRLGQDQRPERLVSPLQPCARTQLREQAARLLQRRGRVAGPIQLRQHAPLIEQCTRERVRATGRSQQRDRVAERLLGLPALTATRYAGGRGLGAADRRGPGAGRRRSPR